MMKSGISASLIIKYFRHNSSFI